MKVLFIDNFPFNLGIAYLVPVLKNAGHEAEVLRFPFPKSKTDISRVPEKYFSFDAVSDQIILKAPDIAAFSVMSSNYMFFRQACEALSRKSGIPVLAGGVLPTISPDLVMTHTACDVLFRGEAEPVIAGLVETIGSGRSPGSIPNILYRKDHSIIRNETESYLEDIDAIPYYDKGIYENPSGTLFMITSRGCTKACSYCSSGLYSKVCARPGSAGVRKRSVDSVVNEIRLAVGERHYRDVFFLDDYFISSAGWLAEFAAAYTAGCGLPYYCHAFPATITEHTASLLASSGCSNVFMGFQTANDDYKRDVLNRPETKAQVARAIHILRDHGIRCSLDHILNLPGETRSHILESLDFYVNQNVRYLSIQFLNYYPESPILEYAHAHGHLSQEQYEAIAKNEMAGEQRFRGTVTDMRKSNEQVRIALLFHLISWLPGRFVIWMFEHDVQRFFPSGKWFYFFVYMMTMLKERGLSFTLALLSFLPSAKTFGKYTGTRRRQSGK